MHVVHDLDPSLQCVIAFDELSGWTIEVNATVNLRCVFGQEHQVTIDTMHPIGRHTDPMLLDAFEWAIRGRRHSVLQLTMLLVDDYIDSEFVDPCLKE